MQKINAILKNYNYEIKITKNNKLNELDKIKRNIELSNNCLNELRIYIREYDFPSNEEEIIFFKYQKPEVLGHLNFYASQLKYFNERPGVTVSDKREYIRKTLKSIEARKKRNIEFYNYYIHNESLSDAIYFLRENNQLYLFTNPFHLNKDPLFFTTNDVKASEVITYNLITTFFKKELNLLKVKKTKTTIKEVKPQILEDLLWTGSKTDLVELIFAFKESSALKGGQVELKKIKEVLELLFEIELGNIHKVFEQIRTREKDPTKFLDSLRNGLIQKINSKQYLF